MANVTLAYKTMQAIEDAIVADQGASFREWEGRVVPHIGDAFRGGEDGHRSHLGASVLGQECARAVWYGFRWVTKPKFGGRILRLFNRGHIEEGRFIAMLLMIGCQVYQQDAQGKQYRISFADGHAGGSGDGVVVNLPDLAPGQPALGEFKTHGEKSFIELAGKLADYRKHLEDPKRNPFTGKGVRDAKFEHYVQMQLYMRKMGIPVALYVAVNKNTDDIYMELITLNIEMADQFLARGEKLVFLPAPPDKINKSPGFFKCVFCDHKPVCHLQAVADINCRTCPQSEPMRGDGARWYCNLHRMELTKEKQLVGCPDWSQDPNL